MADIFKITFAYLAAVIGAGFASGSEIVHYFVRYGKAGAAGVVVSSAGFGLLSYFILWLCKRFRCDSFEELSLKLFGSVFARIIRYLLNLFMVILLGGMICAFAEMVNFLFGISCGVSALLFCLLCYAVLLMPSEKIVKWGGVTGVFIVCLICFCGLYMISERAINVYNPLSVPMSATVYTAYNVFSVCPVLCEWSRMIKSKKSCAAVGVLSCVLSCGALFVLWALISVFYGKISLGEMPVLTIAARQGTGFMLVYATVIFAAVLSSAVSNAYGIYLRMPGGNKKIKLLMILSFGLLISSVGFTRIITVLYKSAGYAVIIVLVLALLINKIKSEKRRKKELNKE